jgi:hypothetical protein
MKPRSPEGFPVVGGDDDQGILIDPERLQPVD